MYLKSFISYCIIVSYVNNDTFPEKKKKYLYEQKQISTNHLASLLLHNDDEMKMFLFTLWLCVDIKARGFCMQRSRQFLYEMADLGASID